MLRGGFDPESEDVASFVGARFADQELTVHQVGGDVRGITVEQFLKLLERRGGVAGIHAFESETVPGEGIVWFLSYKLFQHLAPRFLLSCHGSVSIIAKDESGANRAENEVSMKRKKKKETPGGEQGALQAKPISASRSEMAEVVLPAETNPLGKLLGGHVMHLVDVAAAMAASRHSNSYVVTASVDYIDFRNPISIGEIVILKSQVNRVFHTSMEVGVKVFSENALTAERKHTTTAYVTFVAIDEFTRQPKPVPPLILRTSEEKRRWREAGERRKVRLAVRFKKERE